MLKATKLLLKATHPETATTLLKTIKQHGEKDDILLLYDKFLSNRNPAYLEPIMLLGDTSISDDLFAKAVSNGELRPDYPVETFYALSYLGHSETEHLLFSYYKQLFDSALDWDLHKAVCLSLLNYSCKGYETAIKEEIEKCLATHLFPEFIPVLAYKTGCHNLRNRLYEHGCSKASSDASAGLILGLALYGEDFKQTFQSIIWDPTWEACSSSTGNRNYTLMGMSHLGITLQALLFELQAKLATGNLEITSLFMDYISLLEAYLHAPVSYPSKAIKRQHEPITDIYNAVFGPKDNTTNKLLELIKAYEEKGYDLNYVLDYANEVKVDYETRIALELESGAL
jgi:hypothetical protein